ncbi:MAG: hypothetical protein M3T55_07395 [Pseudomonadota bacterium]|nr:hypothetical protein [Pseudomonadota bacterium]
MSKFAGMRTARAAQPTQIAETAPSPGNDARTPTSIGRQGKKAISGYFSPDLSRGLHMLALEQESNLQALMGEAFDDLMRKYGKHPFGER